MDGINRLGTRERKGMEAGSKLETGASVNTCQFRTRKTNTRTDGGQPEDPPEEEFEQEGSKVTN